MPGPYKMFVIPQRELGAAPRVVRAPYNFPVHCSQLRPYELARVLLGYVRHQPQDAAPHARRRYALSAALHERARFYSSFTLRFFTVISYCPNAHSIVAVSRKATKLGSHANSV
jgi:hypothetical protein